MRTNRYQWVQIVLNVVLIGLLIAVLVQEFAPTPASAAAVAGGPGYVMVPAVAFQPDSPAGNYSRFWGELSVPNGSPGGYTYFSAPVILPHGARLTGLTVYYRDTDADGATVTVEMLRKPVPSMSSGESLNLFINSTRIGFGDLYETDSTPEPSRAVVDNSQYAYYLAALIYATPPGGYLNLMAVRIDYTYDVNAPLVMRK